MSEKLPNNPPLLKFQRIYSDKAVAHCVIRLVALAWVTNRLACENEYMIDQKLLTAQDILARNNVKVRGQGQQTLLFAHGFGTDQSAWRQVAPAFESRYRIVLFDYVGSGNSDHGAYCAERYGTLSGYVQDVLDICDALDLRDVIWVGHSISSMIGVLASIREPQRFARLILVGPSPRYLNDPPDYEGGFERADIDELLDLMDRNYLAWASFLAPMVMQNPHQPELAQALEESFRRSDPAIARQFAKVIFLGDNRADLPRVTVPSLLLQCSDDATVPLCVGEYLHRHLPQSTLRVMGATGHCPHLSQPDETIRLIEEYLHETRLEQV